MISFGEVKVTISSALLNKIRDLNKTVVTQDFASKVGAVVVAGSKEAISKGLSPVQGVGRFVAYKDPESYPGKLKPARPVNLSLTGEMVNSLNFRKEGDKILVGIFADEVGDDVMKRVDTHNRGTHPHVPRRQFIPEKGQSFIVSIQREVQRLYRERISEVIARIVNR